MPLVSISVITACQVAPDRGTYYNGIQVWLAQNKNHISPYHRFILEQLGQTKINISDKKAQVLIDDLLGTTNSVSNTTVAPVSDFDLASNNALKTTNQKPNGLKIASPDFSQFYYSPYDEQAPHLLTYDFAKNRQILMPKKNNAPQDELQLPKAIVQDDLFQGVDIFGADFNEVKQVYENKLNAANKSLASYLMAFNNKTFNASQIDDYLATAKNFYQLWAAKARFDGLVTFDSYDELVKQLPQNSGNKYIYGNYFGQLLNLKPEEKAKTTIAALATKDLDKANQVARYNNAFNHAKLYYGTNSQDPALERAINLFGAAQGTLMFVDDSRAFILTALHPFTIKDNDEQEKTKMPVWVHNRFKVNTLANTGVYTRRNFSTIITLANGQTIDLAGQELNAYFSQHFLSNLGRDINIKMPDNDLLVLELDLKQLGQASVAALKDSRAYLNPLVLGSRDNDTTSSQRIKLAKGEDHQYISVKPYNFASNFEPGTPRSAITSSLAINQIDNDYTDFYLDNNGGPLIANNPISNTPNYLYSSEPGSNYGDYEQPVYNTKRLNYELVANFADLYSLTKVPQNQKAEPGIVLGSNLAGHSKNWLTSNVMLFPYNGDVSKHSPMQLGTSGAGLVKSVYHLSIAANQVVPQLVEQAFASAQPKTYGYDKLAYVYYGTVNQIGDLVIDKSHIFPMATPQGVSQKFAIMMPVSDERAKPAISAYVDYLSNNYNFNVWGKKV